MSPHRISRDFLGSYLCDDEERLAPRLHRLPLAPFPPDIFVLVGSISCHEYPNLETTVIALVIAVNKSMCKTTLQFSNDTLYCTR